MDGLNTDEYASVIWRTSLTPTIRENIRNLLDHCQLTLNEHDSH